jgi:carboxyl-terminal processing protease
VIRRRILLGTLLAVLFGIGWGVGRGRAAGDLYSNLDVFVEVLHAVQTSYVDPVEPRPLIEGGMRGMLRELDPHSEYMDEHAYANLRTSLDEQFDGVGVLVDMHEGYPVIVTPLEGSPAWEAGLLPGDIITKIDDRAVFGLGLPEIGTRMRGAPGTRVSVTVVRQGESDERVLPIERRHIETRSVPYAFVMPQGIGYVRLSSYSSRAGEELAAALDTLRAGGARALVLDLRGNPGGLVEQAVAVVQQLVPEGSMVVYTKGRVASASRKWLAAKSRTQLAWPVAVLVDGGSASAAEITAGALQDLDRGLVVGQTSFGKGTVQDVYPLRNHAGALKLTTAYYYTASGRSLQRARRAEPEAEDDGEDAPADSTPADTSSVKPVFRTASGRTVHGGGGVEPDLEVKPDSLPPLARTLEDRRVAFRFASQQAQQGDAAPTAATWDAYRTFARSLGVGGSDADFERERAPIERGLQREMVRRARGGAAATRLALAADAAYLRAADVLARAKSPRDVFALASGHVPAAVPAARKAR